VLYADMSIVERLNHMMTVGYIPLGQDATVADGGVDFKFKNSSDYPIKISAYTSGATITISIIGTAWEPAREVKISNSTSQVGENTVVRSVRYVYSNGQLISTDTLNSSTYMPHKTETTSQN
ncbi:MAG: VanW family protein, partial [Hominilimicola sp.]